MFYRPVLCSRTRLQNISYSSMHLATSMLQFKQAGTGTGGRTALPLPLRPSTQSCAPRCVSRVPLKLLCHAGGNGAARLEQEAKLHKLQNGRVSPDTDTDTEAEVAELQRRVAHLQQVNAELQQEMGHVVHSLQSALESVPTHHHHHQEENTQQAAQQQSDAAPMPSYHQAATVGLAEMSCSQQHPGSLCCSKTSVATDPGSGTCTVTVSSTARCTAGEEGGPQRHLATPELRALAAQAAVRAAQAAAQAAVHECQAAQVPEEQRQRHAQLLHVLERGQVVSEEPNPVHSQFGHPSFLLQLRDPAGGPQVRAIFKPKLEGDAGGWHRVGIEKVAYELNLLLGMDYVPPVAYRRAGLHVCSMEDQFCYEEGSVMLYVEGACPLRDFPPPQWGASPEVLLSDTRILDVLLHNSDRHAGHFLLGRHWCAGNTYPDRGWVADWRPLLIDHAAGFRREAVVMMEHENAFQTGPVHCVSASTYLRLRLLDAGTVAAKLGEFLSDHEQRQLLHRRNYVLRYLDQLVERQGFAATVRE